MNPGPPAFEASNIPLGYRGGGIDFIQYDTVYVPCKLICLLSRLLEHVLTILTL